MCGAAAVGLGLKNRSDVQMGQGDAVWRLSYDVSFHAPRAGVRLRAAIPDDGPHNRVFRQDLRYSGLKTERLRPTRTETRELSVITQRDGRFHLEACFDIYLSSQVGYRARTDAVQLSADQRAGYLKSTQAIPADDPVGRSATIRTPSSPSPACKCPSGRRCCLAR